MKNIALTLIAPALLLGATFAPIAARADAPINQRLHWQQERIHQGVRSGELTNRERFLAEARDHHIHFREARDRAFDDGRLTSGEHRRLERSLNSNSREIYRFKHNDSTQ